MRHKRTKWILGLSVALIVIAVTGMALAKTPAGAVISNQAVATYKDMNDEQRQTVSNMVYVTVQKVAGVEVTPVEPTEIRVAPNQDVQYSFKVRNTGNADDSFTLATTKLGDLADDVALSLHHDVNGNGIIDGDDIQLRVNSVGPVAAGDVIDIIARFRVPGGAEPEQSVTLALTATSEYDGQETGNSADIKFTVVTEGVITATLSVDKTSVAPEGTITYTALLVNQGMSAVENATVTLPIPLHTTLQSGSVKVNGASIDVSEETGDDSWTHQVSILNGGQGYEISYTVQVNENAPVGVITNSVTVDVDEDTTVTSNEVQTRILLAAGVGLTKIADDVYDYAEVHIGTTYAFRYVVKNTGNGPDMVFANGNMDNDWPVAFYASDGVTPLLTHEGKYTVGTLDAGASVVFVARVTVPTDADTDTQTHTLTVEASTQGGATATLDPAATLRNVKGASVKVTAHADQQTTADPGTVLELKFDVENTGPITDRFNLMLGLTFPADYPASGFSVALFDGQGNPVSSISIGANGTEEITARVTIPAGAPPVDPSIDVTMTATSQNNGDESASDTISVGVNQVYAVSIAPSRTGSATRGGHTTYRLTVQNLGNGQYQETITLTVGEGQLEYNFIDPAGNTFIGRSYEVQLGPNASKEILVRVDVPPTVAVGTVEAMTVVAKITVADAEVSSQATLTTTVTGGELLLEKTAEGENGQSGDDIAAAPGEKITYTVKARNISVGELTSVEIMEKIPQHTTFVSIGYTATERSISVYYSTDGGASWQDVTADGMNSLLPEDKSKITDVKWMLHGILSAGEEIQVELVVEIK